jgi:hypothetical protein
MSTDFLIFNEIAEQKLLIYSLFTELDTLKRDNSVANTLFVIIYIFLQSSERKDRRDNSFFISSTFQMIFKFNQSINLQFVSSQQSWKNWIHPNQIWTKFQFFEQNLVIPRITLSSMKSTSSFRDSLITKDQLKWTRSKKQLHNQLIH